MSIPLQRVKLLRRRAQANAPVALYWLRRVLDDGGAMTRRVHRAMGYNNHKSRYFLQRVSVLIQRSPCYSMRPSRLKMKSARSHSSQVLVFFSF